MTLRAQLNTVSTLLEDGASDSAVRMLRSLWEPELPEEDRLPLYCMWIRALCDTDDLEHAAVLACRAADEFPRDPDILIALGNVHDLRGDLEQAKEAFEHAVDADPAGALQHYNLGAVLERLGDESEAERCYRRAIAVDDEVPSMFEATAALGALLRRDDRAAEALDLYEDYLGEDPLNGEILIECGICLSDLDRFDEACERFHLVLSLEPDHAGALYNLAITLYRMGHRSQAIHVMEQARNADRGTPLTLAVLGEWYLGTPNVDLDEALSLLYGAVDRLLELDHLEGIGSGYASLVLEQVFEALWHHGRQTEAREIARLAGQRDWITSPILEILNEADHGGAHEPGARQVTAFTVMARAEAGEAPEPPEHWPADARGYTTGLTVLAADEAEARKFTLEYLRSVENHPSISFHLDVVRPGASLQTSSSGVLAGAGLREIGPGMTASGGFEPRARGVVSVASTRAYFRSTGGSSRAV